MKRAILFAAAVAAFGQVDLTKLANPPKDSWWTYHGDYTGQRNSKLGAITVDNVANLKQAWTFSTGQNQAIKAVPILADGVLYITTPDN